MKRTSLDAAGRIAWLRLARTETVGPVAFAHLIARFGDAQAALDALPDLARRAGRGLPPRSLTVEDAERELARGDRAGARLIAACEPEFPPMLTALDPPPPLLWVIGESALLSRRMVAIVGARVASAAGRRFARTLAQELGEAGYGVISGMARGIDAAAHEGSLAHGPVAVIAGGVDTIYPPENERLYREILARGCAVSERAIGHVAKARDFPRRNRIVSGLALGVIVVEAELRSGSLITARLAGEQGREVFAVPGSPLDPRARGANDLIRQGATLVETAEDVLRVLDDLPGLIERRPASPAAPPLFDPGDHGDHGDGAEEATLREAVAGLLSPTPALIDDIARAAEAPVASVLAALTELSLAGRADFVGNGMAIAV